MQTIKNWIQRHKLAMLGLGIGLCAIMVAPDFADAGHRRRARRCWRQAGYYAHPHTYTNYGYSNYGYSNYGYRGYNNAGVYHSGGVQGDITYDGGFSADTRSTLDADVDQRGTYRAARPGLEGTEGDIAPPAPVDSQTRGSLDARMNQRTEFDFDGPMNRQQQQQVRQRINSLQNEITRLETQLRNSQQSGNRVEGDVESRQRSGAEAQLNNNAEAEAGAGANIETDTQNRNQQTPQQNEAQSESQTEAEANAETNN